MSQERDGAAIEKLQELAAQGVLQFPEPGLDAAGHMFTPWDEDTDGDVLACYMDILGLGKRAQGHTLYPSPFR